MDAVRRSFRRSHAASGFSSGSETTSEFGIARDAQIAFQLIWHFAWNGLNVASRIISLPSTQGRGNARKGGDQGCAGQVLAC